MTNQTLQLIASRRSHRSYKPQQISTEQLEALMTVALQSPSALNKQPWHFSFIQNADLLHRVSSAAHKQAGLLDPSARSSRFDDPSFHIFYNAPTVVFISAPNGEPALDCGIAVHGLALAAESMGLGSVIIALSRLAFSGCERTELEKALGFPDGNQMVISIAIGIPNDDKPAHELNCDKITLIS